MLLKNIFMIGELITVEPVNAENTNEKYDPELNTADKVITRKDIEDKIKINSEYLKNAKNIKATL